MQDAPYRWIGYRIRQLSLAPVFGLMFLVPIWLGPLSDTGAAILVAGAVSALLAIMWRTGRFACPRCGKAIAGGRWIPSRSIAPLGYPSECAHCKLKVGSRGTDGANEA